MAALHRRNSSFGFANTSSNHSASGHTSSGSEKPMKIHRHRKSLWALSAAASAVSVLGLGNMAAKADVITNTDGMDSFVDLTQSNVWLDVTSPSVDNPAESGNVVPTAQDIAQWDNITGNRSNNGNSVNASPGTNSSGITQQSTYTLSPTSTTTWAGINVLSPAPLQYSPGGSGFATYAINITGTNSLVLGNTSGNGSPTSGVNVYGTLSTYGVANPIIENTNPLVLATPLSLAASQTWTAGQIYGINNAGTDVAVGGNTITVSGNFNLNNNTLTITGAQAISGNTDLTSGNVAISGIVSGSGGFIVNSTVGTLVLSNTNAGGTVISTTTNTAGTLTLSSVSNTFTGGVTLINGSLSVGAEGNLGDRKSVV